MATNKQEVELIIRAREVGTKSFKTTADSVAKLTRTLTEQTEAASKGQVSTAALTATMKKLEDAGAALIKQQALIDFHQRLATQLGEAEKKAEAAADAHRELAAAQEAAEKVTRTEERQLASMAKAADAAGKRVEKLTADLAGQSARLEQAGISTANLAEDQERLVRAAQEVGLGLTVAGRAVDDYEINLKRLAATQDRVAAQAEQWRMDTQRAELQRTTQYVNFWTQALVEAERQERELAEVQGFQQKLADAKQLRQATEYVDFWTQSLDRAEQQERQLAELNAFRKIGADAQTSAAGIGSLNRATGTGATANSRFAASLQAMIDPAGAARMTLAGLEAEVEKVTADVGNGSKAVREYQEAFNDLGRVQAAIMKQAGAIDSYRNQEIAVRAATQALAERRTELRLAAAAVQGAAAPNEALVATLRQQEIAAEDAARALDNETRKLERLAAPLKAAGINTRSLTKEQERLAEVSRRTAAAVNTLDGAMQGQGSRTGRFLGLRPYELQNLGYQLNDVFTQIASGTSITQTFAQQSGQFAQIPGVLSAVVKFLPQLTALVVVLGSTYAAIKRITDLEASQRAFAKELAASADGALYNAQALAQMARTIEDTGVKAKDARGAVSAFVREGVDPDRILAFTQAARAMSKVTGDDLPTAAGKMAEAFTHGYDAIVKLDNELNFLTATERDHIRVLFDSGRAKDAQTYAFDRFAAKQHDAARAAKGPWTDAVKSLTNAWREFIDWMGRSSFIRDTVKELTFLAEQAERLAKALPGAGGGTGAAAATLAPGVRPAGGGALAGLRRQRTGDAGNWVTGNGQYADQNRAVARFIGGSGREDPNGKIIVTPEIRDIVATVMLEAINDPAAQRDVAAVIMNRIQRTGTNGSAVVRQPGQFQPVQHSAREWNAINENSARFAETLANIAPILAGAVASPVGDATMFYSPAGQAANVRNGLSRDLTPKWATPDTFVGERAGHRFYNGAFAGDRGIGRGQEGPNEADAKAGADYLRELEEQRRATQQVTDAERVRQAGLDALREAQARGADEAGARAAQEYAAATEQFKVDRERAAQSMALAGEIASSAQAAAQAQDQSLGQRLAAITQRYDVLFSKIEEGRARGLSEAGGQTLDALEAQARADMVAVQQRETMAFYEDRLAQTERERVELLEQINSQLANGAISARDAVIQTQETNERFLPLLEGISTEAAAFAESIKSATPSPRLDAFLARMQSAPLDATASTARASLKIYEDAIKGLTDARDSAMAGIVDQLDQGAITAVDALTEAQRIQTELNPAIAEMAQSAVTFAQGIAGAVPSPALSAFLASMRQIDERASQTTAGTNPRANPVANVGVAALASEEEKLNAIIARRNEQAGIYNTLVERRVITEGEARTQTQALYAETQPLIDAQVLAMQSLLANMVQLGIVTPQVYDLWMAKLQGVTAEAGYLDEKTMGIQRQLESTFATGFVSSFTTALGGLIKGTEEWNARIAEGKSAFVAARDAFRTFAADFLLQIAQMIFQQMILNALQTAAGAGGGTGGGWFGGLARMIVGKQHNGTTGGDIRKSNVSPSIFFNAPRYHEGRNPMGLDATEEAAIIKKDEEVLTSDNPRHIKNWMGGSAKPAAPPIVDVAVNNYVDGAAVLDAGLSSKEGTESILNWMGQNARAVKARIGG